MIGLGSDKNVREWEKFWSSQTVKPPNHHFCVDFRDGHGTELTHFLSLMTHFEEGALSLFGPIGFMGCIHTPAPAQCLN